MPSWLERYYHLKHLHFITGSCYHRLHRLSTEHARDLFLVILEQARQSYRFVVVGYVVMPEHFHLLISEPEIGDPSVVMKVVKERFSRQIHASARGSGSAGIPHSFANAANEWATLERVWQKRFYDFNVWSERKRVEKLRYMHRNPVKRGLVSSPERWPWSSFRAYAYGETGLVRVNVQEWKLEVKPVPRQSFGGNEVLNSPLICKKRE